MPKSRKLIEVALPLESINRESAREKSIRHGHPSTLHLWWARRPLAACRAVLFASLVDDPSSHPDRFPTEEAQEKERKRLFGIIEKLVKWENSNNEHVLEEARAEIRRSTGGDPPPVLDPFCGGGSIPLEAQRLGLEAYAGDLNPVAVLITKALIEIPPRFAGRPPVHPSDKPLLERPWKGAQGLAEDVCYYGQWMRDDAQRRIGHLYPKVRLPKENGGGEATVIAWLWARTVKCPNPACGVDMPLVRSFELSQKKGKKAWVQPILNKNAKRIGFEVKTGEGLAPDGTVSRRGARCIVCQKPVPFERVRSEGKAGRMAVELMAIVAEGPGGRIYVPPHSDQARIAQGAAPAWRPEAELPHNPRDFKTPNYGMRNFSDLFTARQLVALTTFSDLVAEARERVLEDAKKAGLPDDGKRLSDGGTGATAYADAVATYLGIGVSKLADYNCTNVTWSQSRDQAGHAFTKQAIPMVWDYAEVNPFARAAGDLSVSLRGIGEVIEASPLAHRPARCEQQDAMTGEWPKRSALGTDPPYYDNIGYADLSDFFYVWLRRSLAGLYPGLFGTMLTPKKEELVATPYRFDGDKDKAKLFFEQGLGRAFARMKAVQHSEYPLTVFYAFKQAETDEGEDEADRVASTGWETMLEGLLRAGFEIRGTWPMRSERGARSVAIGTNALASSIVLACRPRPEDASLATRREFLNALKNELPQALKTLQHGNIAPVDFAQASIGPGMAVFSRYSRVLEADGSPMTVRAALALINKALDEVLAEQEGELDPDTRWAVAWFEQHALGEAAFGEAETLSKAKNVSVEGLEEAGILRARASKVRLLTREEMDADWDPVADSRLTVWEVAQHLIRALDEKGEHGAAGILKRVGGLGDAARDLAYRLYQVCDRKGWAKEAGPYNRLVVAWPAIAKLASSQPVEQQTTLSLGTE